MGGQNTNVTRRPVTSDTRRLITKQVTRNQNEPKNVPTSPRHGLFTSALFETFFLRSSATSIPTLDKLVENATEKRPGFHYQNKSTYASDVTVALLL